MKLIIPIFCITTSLILSGCAGMNGDFGCNATAGRGCASVSEVNARVDANTFQKKHVQRIWIAPYQEGENYHESSYIDTVL